MSEKIVSVKSFTNPGDGISALCGIKNYCDENDAKAIFYQQVGVENDYYFGAQHPTKNEYGKQVCCNDEMFEMMKPLFKSQYYIEDFVEWKGEKVDFDLGVVRHGVSINLPYLAIQTWDGLYYPELQGDISKEWLTVTETLQLESERKILIQFTERYRIPYLSYYFLKPYEPYLLFTGTENEHELFTKRWALNIPYQKANHLYELAEMVVNSRFTLSNQSVVWNIAQATSHPRLLELCPQFPNCVPNIGKYSYGYYHQHVLEQLFKKLYDMK